MDGFKENLEHLLLEEHSRHRTDEVAGLIGGDADRFAVAWDIFCNSTPPLPQRMAWVLDVVTKAHPSLAARYAASIASRLPFLQHPAELRAATNILARTILPTEALSELLVILFEWLEDPQKQAAIRCHSMQILYNISELEPDLKRELATVIGLQMEYGCPAIISIGRRLLSKLRVEIRRIELAEAEVGTG